MKPVWLTAACLATLLLIACGPQEPIRIGFIGELTGNSADLGEAGRNGAMLAIEQANQSGGINGRPIELLARDTGSTPATAINSAKELLDARVVAVIGTMTSGMTSSAVSKVVNRSPQDRHSRRRRIWRPSAASRESLTLVSTWPQKGQYMTARPVRAVRRAPRDQGP